MQARHPRTLAPPIGPMGRVDGSEGRSSAGDEPLEISSLEQYKSIWKVLAIALGICVVVQLAISFDTTNFLCCLMAWFGSMIVAVGALRPENMQTRPLSTWSVITFGSVGLAVPLAAKTIELEPIVYNLDVPITTFIYATLATLVLVASHYVYGKTMFLRRLRRSITQRALVPLGLFRSPSTSQLFLMGLVGSLSMIIVLVQAKANGVVSDVSTSGDASTGIAGKFLQSVSDFAFAPAAITLSFLYKRNPTLTKREKGSLIAFFVIILGLALARGGRGIFAIPVATILVGYVVGAFSGRLTKKMVEPRRILTIVALMIIGIPFASRLSIAIVLARAYRKTSSPIELMQITVEKYQDSQAIEDFLASSSPDPTTWNETYVHNTLLGRFVSTKFIDLGFRYTQPLGESDRQRMVYFLTQRSVTFLPGPILRMAGIDVDKTFADSGSVGDYLFYLATGHGLGGFRVVHMIPIDQFVFGDLFLAVLFVLSIPIFLLIDTLSIPLVRMRPSLAPNGAPQPVREIVFSPAVVMTLYTTVIGLLSPATITAVASYVFRGFPQYVLVYALLASMTSILNPVWRSRSSALVPRSQ